MIGDAKAGRELLPLVHRPAEVGGNAADAGHMEVAILEVKQGAIAGPIGRLWEVEIPAKAEVEGQRLGGAPGVLRVEEGALLELLGVGGGGDVAVKAGYVTHHEGCKAQATLRQGIAARAIRWIGGGTSAEVEQAGAVVVRRYAQVAAVAQVGAHLERVVADDPSPVIDDLELIFALCEGAVATVHAQAVAVDGAVGAAAAAGDVGDVEARRAGGDVAADVDAGNAQGGCELCALVMLGVDDVISVVAQPEVGEQLGADGDVHARRQAVVGSV